MSFPCMPLSFEKCLTAIGLTLIMPMLAIAPSQAIVWEDSDQTFAEIVLDSTLGIQGQIIDITTHSLEGSTVAYPNLYSEILIEVEQAYVGASAGDRIVVRQYGGYRDVDGYWTDIAGLYQYRIGESVILFQNDLKMPMYASYKGDLGMRRVVTLDRGDRVVLTQQGTAFLADTTGYTLDVTHCVPDDWDPRRCESWVDEDDFRGDEPGTTALTVEDFDVMIQAILTTGTPPTGPAQTVTTDTQFRALMSDFVTALDASNPPSELDPTSSPTVGIR